MDVVAALRNITAAVPPGTVADAPAPGRHVLSIDDDGRLTLTLIVGAPAKFWSFIIDNPSENADEFVAAILEAAQKHGAIDAGVE